MIGPRNISIMYKLICFQYLPIFRQSIDIFAEIF